MTLPGPSDSLTAAADAAAGRQPRSDAVTGLPTRAGIEQIGTRVWARRAAAGEPLAVLLVEVDGAGQQASAPADETVLRIVDLVLGALRPEDHVARIDERRFLLLVPVPPLLGAVVAERVRESVEDGGGGATVSIGVVEVEPDLTDALPDALWSAVDDTAKALRSARVSGGNLAVEGNVSPIRQRQRL